jgi:molybdopterin synthase catalytic subunit
MIRIQREPFDAGKELDAMTRGRRDVGAAVAFVGLVREMGDTGNVCALTLEHYPEMTARELERIEEDARSRWPLLDALVIHRFGVLEPGDPIVLVITLSAHRGAAFAAAEFLMDYLKTKAPFWKSERSSDGEAWVDAKDSDDTAADRWTDKT